MGELQEDKLSELIRAGALSLQGLPRGPTSNTSKSMDFILS